MKFIHTADIHFGMENYGKVDPTTGIHTRLLDFVKALNACIDTAITENVDFFLFCGDAYKTAHPSQTQQRLLIQCFMRLYDAGIPVVIVVGNHDHPLSFGKANALELFSEFPLNGFHVISKPRIVILQTKSGPISIVGMPWPTRNALALKNEDTPSYHITEYIAQAATTIIQRLAQQLDPLIPAVLAGHLTVSNGIFSGSEKRAVYGTDPLFLPSQLALEPFDYVALGHLHRHQNLNPQGTIPIVYSGSIERIDFGERKETKGFCLVTIYGKGKTGYQFITTPQRPFIQIEVQLTEDIDQTEQIITELARHPIKDAVLKIIYHLTENMSDRVDLKRIQHTCQSAMYIVGIIPIRSIQTRQYRMNKEHMHSNPETLLSFYFDHKKETQSRKPILLQKALELLATESTIEE